MGVLLTLLLTTRATPVVSNTGTFFVKGTDTRYCILERLGAGVTCLTDLIEEVDNKEKYVMKSMESYLAEVKISTHEQYNHPNIARLIQHFTLEDSRVHMLFPYYEEGSLENKLAQQVTSLDIRTVLYWFLDACHAVQYLHHKGKITIDIRAANFYINETNNLILLNIDKKWDSYYQRLYCAPEFIREENRIVNRQNDIWSLGCLLFELIYLKSPFQNIYEIKGLIHASDMTSIDYPHYNVSQKVSRLMEDMLEYDFNKRPSIDDLEVRTNNIYKTLL